MVTVGIDEVGRGCWAGPLVAGAVVLSGPIAGLKDSKQLSKLQRERLVPLITAQAAAVGLGWVSPEEVDTLGLTKAVGLAMARALKQITIEYDDLIIDGNINYFPADHRSRAIIKADDLVPAVSAASIMAKVARDAYMTKVLHKKFPNYGFAQHVGYGTKLHSDSLKQHGICEAHRLSFRPIKQFQGNVA